MKELESRLESMADAKSSLHQDLVWTLTIPPARKLIWRAYGHLRVLRTIEGARVSIVLATKVILVSASWLHLVSIHLEYRIRNYLLIVV